MRLALFVPSLGGGGAERVMLSLAAGFAAQGHDVDLVLVHAGGPYLSEVPTSVNLVDLDSSRILASIPKLVRYLRSERPAALLSTLGAANVVAVWARAIAQVPTRVVVREATTLSLASANSASLRARLLPLLVRRAYRQADGVIAISKGVANDLSEMLDLPPERIHVVYNPVVIGDVVAKADAFVNHPWFKPGAPPVILSAGRLTAAKDFALLIRAFSRVRRSVRAHLVILGEGELRKELEELSQRLGVADDVWMPGFAKNPYRYMARADVFAFTSRWEGFGLVLVEAMAVGTPVVSTDYMSGAAEILGDGKYGRLVPPGDEEAMATAIIEAIVGGPEWEEVKRHAMGRARSFTLDAAIKGYAAVLLHGL